MTKTRNVLSRFVLGAIAAASFVPGSLFGAYCGPDLSTQFQIRPGRQYKTNDGLVHQTIGITNLGATTKGSLYLMISNLPANVQESPFTWTAACDPGARFLRIYLGYQNQFDANTTKSITLNFAGVQALPFSYSLHVIKGSLLPNPRAVAGDYDGDGIADPATYAPATGMWTIRRSTDTIITKTTYGTPNLDHSIVGDFDGDLKNDLAVYRPSTGTFFVLRSSDHVSVAHALGAPNTGVPVPADYDGDGYTDLAVYNKVTGVFTVLQSTDGNIVTKQIGFAVPGDIPVPADYDGDGKADIAIFRPSSFVFSMILSTTNKTFGMTDLGYKGGVPFAADLNGDGRAEACTYNPVTGLFYGNDIKVAFTWLSQSVPQAKPIVADFSGEGKSDLAFYDNVAGVWSIDADWNNQQPHATVLLPFGNPPGDIAVMTIPALLW